MTVMVSASHRVREALDAHVVGRRKTGTETRIVNRADALARRHDVDGDGALDLGAVVYVTGTLPWPVTSGGHLRTLGNLKALVAIAPTHLVAFPTEPGERPPIELASTTIWPVAAATRLGRLRHRLVATVRRRHPYVQRLMSQGGLEALSQVIETTGARTIVVEWPFYPVVADVFRSPGRRFVADVADDRIAAARQAFRFGSRPAARARALLNLMTMPVTEGGIWRMDQAWFAGAADAQRTLRHHPGTDCRVVPNVVDVARLAARRPQAPEPCSVAFLGSFDYAPNEVAALRFLRGIGPRLRAAQPDCRLGVIGRRPGRLIRDEAVAHGAVLLADVPDALEALARYQIMIVPLTIGTGTRLKILEALASGIPVVTTAVGMAGLDLVPGRDLLVGESDADLAEAVLELWRSPKTLEGLASHGRSVVAERYGPARLQETIASALHDLRYPDAGLGEASTGGQRPQ
jgi:glycosyltransferase involved in cell wall biosynthesis